MKLLKGDLELVAKGKSDADKTGFVSKFAAKNEEGLCLLERSWKVKSQVYIRASGCVVNASVTLTAATG